MIAALAALAVRVAVALLPGSLRDRYREQWNADLRDAAEAGIRTSDVALGSLAFAVTLGRPVSRGAGTLTPVSVERRSRFAAGLALGSALTAISQYASIGAFGGLTGNGVYDFVISFGFALLLAFSVLAPIVAVAIATVTRGVAPRVRLAVLILVIASCAGLVHAVVDGSWTGAYNVYTTPGTLVYPVALALTVTAIWLLWGAFRTPRTRVSPLDAVLPGVVVLAAGAVGLAHAAVVWAGRAPLEFAGPEWGRANWVSLEEQFELTVNGILLGWAIASLLVAILVVVVAHRVGRHVAWVVIAGMCALLIAHAAVLSFLQLGSDSVVPLVRAEVLLLAGRWGLIVVALATVGGVRFTRQREPAVGRIETRSREARPPASA